MNFLRHTLNAAAVDIFAPPASGATVAALSTGQTTQDGKIAALEAANTANPPHPHTNKATLDAITGHGNMTIAGSTITLTKPDGTTVDVIVPAANVLSTTTPPAYNDATNTVTFTWTDNSTSNMDLTDLFDAKAVKTIARTNPADPTVRTLTATLIDDTTAVIDIDPFFAALLTKAEAINGTDDVEGLASGRRLKESFDQHCYYEPLNAGGNLEWGKRYSLYKDQNYVWPDPASGGPGVAIECIPADGTWHDFDPVTRWTAAGAITLGAGQAGAIQNNYAVLLFGFDFTAASNIKVYG